MKKSYIKSAIYMLAAAGLFSACSSDGNEPNLPQIDENFEGILLSIPNNAATRATTTSNEGNVNDLTVIAYNTTDLTKPAKVTPFTSTQLSAVNRDSYTMLPVVLPAGTYHIYVLANIDAYTVGGGKGWDDMKESDLVAGKFTGMAPIPATDVNKTTGQKFLPMSCHNKDLKLSDKGAAIGNTGSITITAKKHTSVYADLTFCVSKVRVTMLNNAVPNLYLGNGFTATDGTKLSKYATEVGTLAGLSTPELSGSDVAVAGSYYTHPADAATNPASWTITDLTSALTEAPNDGFWAWQTTYYIPENLYKDDTADDSKTKLNFTFTVDAYNTSRVLGEKAASSETASDAYTSGLVRGKFYDVLGYTTKKELKLLVRVRPWQYHKYTIDLE